MGESRKEIPSFMRKDFERLVGFAISSDDRQKYIDIYFSRKKVADKMDYNLESIKDLDEKIQTIR